MPEFLGCAIIREHLEKGGPGAIQTHNVGTIGFQVVAVAAGEFRKRFTELFLGDGGFRGEFMDQRAVIRRFKGADHVALEEMGTAGFGRIKSHERRQRGVQIQTRFTCLSVHTETNKGGHIRCENRAGTAFPLDGLAVLTEELIQERW